MNTRIFRLGAAILVTGFIAFFLLGGGAWGMGLGVPAPELKGGPWLNSEPLKMKDLRGKVVLIEMWTYT